MRYASIIASLPMLRFGETPAVSLDDFREHCALLTEADAAELDALLEGNQDALRHPFLLAWFNADAQLRCAVARSRAEATNTDATPSLREYTGHSVLTERTVEDAMTARNPLETERMLDARRWQLADEFAFDDPYGMAGVLAYALKLQIARRWAALDEEKARQVLESFMVDNLKEEGTMAQYLG